MAQTSARSSFARVAEHSGVVEIPYYETHGHGWKDSSVEELIGKPEKPQAEIAHQEEHDEVVEPESEKSVEVAFNESFHGKKKGARELDASQQFT